MALQGHESSAIVRLSAADRPSLRHSGWFNDDRWAAAPQRAMKSDLRPDVLACPREGRAALRVLNDRRRSLGQRESGLVPEGPNHG